MNSYKFLSTLFFNNRIFSSKLIFRNFNKFSKKSSPNLNYKVKYYFEKRIKSTEKANTLGTLLFYWYW